MNTEIDVTSQTYLPIVEHYERCLEMHGSGARAVDWKSEEDAAIRYEVMLGLIVPQPAPVSLLDFGCGLAGLADHLRARGPGHVTYAGLDLSPAFVAEARGRHPQAVFHIGDILEQDLGLPMFDYVVMNGIFTRRETLDEEAMWLYLGRLTEKLFSLCRIGLAFNVMSTAVDFRLPALFHAEPGRLAELIAGRLSRHFAIRNDYGLYETTAYVYHRPRGLETQESGT